MVGGEDCSSSMAISLKSAHCAVTFEQIDALVEMEITTMMAMMRPSFASKLRCRDRGRLQRKSMHCQSCVGHVIFAVQRLLFWYFGLARRKSADGGASYSNHNPKSYLFILTAMACFSKSHPHWLNTSWAFRISSPHRNLGAHASYELPSE